MTPVDVFFYVLEGTGIVEIGDKKKAIGIYTGRKPGPYPAHVDE
jgi:mannose-6-phosphate isomerase-like protein (cupin superfamily)